MEPALAKTTFMSGACEFSTVKLRIRGARSHATLPKNLLTGGVFRNSISFGFQGGDARPRKSIYTSAEILRECFRLVTHQVARFLFALFARLFEAAESEMLIQWLPKLIRLPYFDSSTPDGWRDPIRLLPTGVWSRSEGPTR